MQLDILKSDTEQTRAESLDAKTGGVTALHFFFVFEKKIFPVSLVNDLFRQLLESSRSARGAAGGAHSGCIPQASENNTGRCACE